MKKVLSALLSSAIIMSNVSALPFSTNAAWKGQYEFEKGKIVNAGENGAEIMSVSGASGGKAVDIKDGGNIVSLTVNAENSGAHRLSIRYNQPYDEDGKYQNILVNGKNVISGQQESTWMGSENYEFDIIKNASGKYPAKRGLDYMGDDFSGCNRRSIDWYKKGGIVTICWHCGSDFRGSHTESLDSDLNWSSALTPGTSEYNALIAGMDKGAKALLELKEAGVPVIWRPFHEFDGKMLQ